MGTFSHQNGKFNFIIFKHSLCTFKKTHRYTLNICYQRSVDCVWEKITVYAEKHRGRNFKLLNHMANCAYIYKLPLNFIL